MNRPLKAVIHKGQSISSNVARYLILPDVDEKLDPSMTFEDQFGNVYKVNRDGDCYALDCPYSTR